MKDNSDSRIADMLIQGMTIGVLSVSKKIDNYNEQIIMQNDLRIDIKEIIDIKGEIFKNISF